MLEPRPQQAEMVEQAIQKLARTGRAHRPYRRKIRQAEPARFVNLST